MRAGTLRHRLDLQVRTVSQNSIGEWIETWSTQASIWAAVEPLTGARFFQAKQANADVTGVIRIRHREGLQPTMRFLWGARVLRILSIINPEERGREVEILYRELAD